MLYLQVWAWMRLPMFTPRISRDQRRAARFVGPIVTDDGINLPSAPAAARYTQFMLSFTLVVRNNLLASREQLDTQHREVFIWQPYRQDDIASLPLWCPPPLFLYEGPLVHNKVVEYIWTSRVRRQFGMRQDIPQNPSVESDAFHSYTRDDHMAWNVVHTPPIQSWANRLNLLIGDASNIITEAQYFYWYEHVTRRLIINPLHRAEGTLQTGSSSFIDASAHQLTQFGHTADSSLLQNIVELSQARMQGRLPRASGEDTRRRRNMPRGPRRTTQVPQPSTSGISRSSSPYMPSTSGVPHEASPFRPSTGGVQPECSPYRPSIPDEWAASSSTMPNVGDSLFGFSTAPTDQNTWLRLFDTALPPHVTARSPEHRTPEQFRIRVDSPDMDMDIDSTGDGDDGDSDDDDDDGGGNESEQNATTQYGRGRRQPQRRRCGTGSHYF